MPQNVNTDWIQTTIPRSKLKPIFRHILAKEVQGLRDEKSYGSNFGAGCQRSYGAILVKF